MIAVIRIKGMVGLREDIEETLDRLKLRRKFACVVLREKPELIGMIKKLESFVAYGRIDEKTLEELIKKRGKSPKKFEAEKITKEFIESRAEKKLSDFGLNDIFRLHPPRGGFESKEHFPRGILGNHGEKINELIRRML